MIALYVPFITNVNNVGGCSIYNSNTHFFRTWLERDENFSVVFPIIEGLKYTDFIEHPRVKTVLVKDNPNLYGSQQYRRSAFLREGLINKFFGEDSNGLFCDVVINTKPRIAPLIQLSLGGVFGESPVPLVNYSFFRTSKKDQYYSSVNTDFDRAYTYGMTFGHCSFETDEIFRRFKKEASAYLSPAMIRKVDRERITNCGSITVQRIMDAIEGVERPTTGPIIMHHSGRLSASDHGDKIFEMVNEVYSTGHDVKVVITSQTAMGRYSNRVLSELEEKGFDGVDIHPQCPQKEFWRTAAASHIRISNTHHGEFYNALAEQIVCGVVPIMREASFMKPLWEDYPFSYSNMNDLRYCLNFVIENYWKPEVQEPFKALREKVISTIDSSVLHNNLIDDIVGMVKTHRSPDRIIGPFIDMSIQATNELGDEFSFNEFALKVISVSDTGLDPRKLQPLNRTNRYDWHRAICGLGYEAVYHDDYDVMRYVKVKRWQREG